MNFLKKYIDIKLHSKWGLLFGLGFVLFTIIGTLTHELGHIAFAKAQGYETSLHYGYMTYKNGTLEEERKALYTRNQNAIDNDLPFPDKERWEAHLKESRKKGSWIIFGGPFQTVLFGTIGFLVLYRRRRRILKVGMTFSDWLFVFLSLFWLREWYNPMFSMVRAVLKGNLYPFGGSSDELDLARSLGWWEGSISLPLAMIAIVIAIYVIFRIIPKTFRFTFILSGLIGGVFGFFFWLEWVGPIVMP